MASSGAAANPQSAEGSISLMDQQPLPSVPGCCQFDVEIHRKGSESLGATLQSTTAMTSRKTIVRITGFKRDAAGNMPPAEVTGLIREDDIIIGVGGADMNGLKFTDVTACIKQCPPGPVVLRLARPVLGARLRGVATGAECLPAASLESQPAYKASCFAKVLLGDKSLLFGPFVNAPAAAAAYDSLILAAFGTRAASCTNFQQHVATKVRAVESRAQTLAAAGDAAGARQLLDTQASYKDYSYGGEAASKNAAELVSLDSWILAIAKKQCEGALAKRQLEQVQSLSDASDADKAARQEETDISAVLAQYPGLALAASPAWRSLQWEALGADASGAAPGEEASSSSSDDCGDLDDGKGHKPTASEPAVAKPALQFDPSHPPRHEVQSQVAIGKASPADHPADGTFPALLPYLPWGPAYGPCYGDGQGAGGQGLGISSTGLGIGADVSLRKDAKQGKAGFTVSFREAPATVLYSVVKKSSGAGAAAASSSSSAAAASASSTTSSSTGTGTCPPSTAYTIRDPSSIHKGPGERHSIFYGVRWAKDGCGAFAIWAGEPKFEEVGPEASPAAPATRSTRSGAAHPPAPSPAAPTRRLVASSGLNETVLGYYDTAVQAALSYDREARRRAGLPTNTTVDAAGSTGSGAAPAAGPPQADPYVNFKASNPTLLLSLLAFNILHDKPELSSFPKTWLDGPACADHIATVRTSCLLQSDVKSVGHPKNYRKPTIHPDSPIWSFIYNPNHGPASGFATGVGSVIRSARFSSGPGVGGAVSSYGSGGGGGYGDLVLNGPDDGTTMIVNMAVTMSQADMLKQQCEMIKRLAKSIVPRAYEIRKALRLQGAEEGPPSDFEPIEEQAPASGDAAGAPDAAALLLEKQEKRIARFNLGVAAQSAPLARKCLLRCATFARSDLTDNPFAKRIGGGGKKGGIGGRKSGGGGGSRKKKRSDEWDSDADEDEEEEEDAAGGDGDDDGDEEDGAFHGKGRSSMSGGPRRQSNRSRSGRAITKRYTEDDADLDAAIDGEDGGEPEAGGAGNDDGMDVDDEDHMGRAKPKFMRKKAGGAAGAGAGAGGASGRKSASKAAAAKDEDDYDSDGDVRQGPDKSLPEDGVEKWTIEKMIAVRYADLPLTDDEQALFDAKPAPTTTEEEFERDRESMDLQLAKRMALPVDQRRGVAGWETIEFLVKWKGLSHLHVEWVTSAVLRDCGNWGPIKAKRYLVSPEAQAQLDDEEARMREGRDWPTVDAFFDEDCVAVERILAERICEVDSSDTGIIATAGGAVWFDRQNRGPDAGEEDAAHIRGGGAFYDGKTRKMCFLVKWKGMPYGEATWEWTEDIRDDQALARFEMHNRMPNEALVRTRYNHSGEDERPSVSQWRMYKAPHWLPQYRSGRSLRDYQLEGLNWMVFNWYNRRNCILADEMGLGKTIQTVSMLNHLFTQERVRGPFLVVAPLSTLGHWKREFEEWTEMNAVYYHDPTQGSGAEARALIRRYEWAYPGKQGEKLAKSNIFKFNAVITSNNVLISDFEFFQSIKWRYVVVDEAHSLKNRNGQLQQALQVLKYDALMLLTGTPLQNDSGELWPLLRLVSPNKFRTLDEFLSAYGNLQTVEQLNALNEELRPIMLRRVKEDVEKSIPPKEETLINVELTTVQKQYYRAIFERNRSFLTRGAANAAPAALVNIEMELRKCCNHPFLLRNSEQRETLGCKTKAERAEVLVACSGKMVLLDKLYTKLHAEGHRVLLFSQFKMMLGLLEEHLQARGFKYERIDGTIRGNERQAAIDRFNKPGSDIFAFLLSTKAGGQGINLTAADTVIIFDSDWNPQNDVQAMARAHRIGQTKDVRIYRLVTSKTYEAEMFKRASKKLGLSQAVLEGAHRHSAAQRALEAAAGGDGGGEGGVTAGLATVVDRDKVEALLRFGAYALAEGDDATNDASKTFAESSIDAILGTNAVTVRYDASGKVVGGTGGSGEEGGAGAGSSGATPSGHQPSSVLSRATFRSADSDSNVDVSDPSFWEKVLGPKPGAALLSQLTSQPSILEADDATSGCNAKVAQWVADLTALLDDVHAAKENNETHEAAEPLASLLVMLQVVGKKIPHPLSPAALANRNSSAQASGANASSASSSSSGATTTSAAGVPNQLAAPLPPPMPSLAALLTADALNAALQRAAASAGHGLPPAIDEDGIQHDGSLADFAVWWVGKLEVSNRQRKRQNRGSMLPARINADEEDGEGGEGEGGATRGRPRGRPRGSGRGGAGAGGGRGRGRGRGGKAGLTHADADAAAADGGDAAGGMEVEGAGGGDGDLLTPTPASGGKRKRGGADYDDATGAGAADGGAEDGDDSATPAAAAAASTGKSGLLPGEREADPVSGLPSVSGIRIRLTPFKHLAGGAAPVGVYYHEELAKMRAEEVADIEKREMEKIANRARRKAEREAAKAAAVAAGAATDAAGGAEDKDADAEEDAEEGAIDAAALAAAESEAAGATAPAPADAAAPATEAAGESAPAASAPATAAAAAVPVLPAIHAAAIATIMPSENKTGIIMPHGHYEHLYPAFMLRKTGYTRAQILAAAAGGISVQEYCDQQRIESEKAWAGESTTAAASDAADPAAAAAAGAGGPAPLSYPITPLLLHNRAETKRLAVWHMMNRVSKAAAVRPIMAAPRLHTVHGLQQPQPTAAAVAAAAAETAAAASAAAAIDVSDAAAAGGADDADGAEAEVPYDVNVEVPDDPSNPYKYDPHYLLPSTPMRLMLIYSMVGGGTKKMMKPDGVRGPPMLAPQWALDGKAVDQSEEGKRAERRTANATKAKETAAGKATGEGGAKSTSKKGQGAGSTRKSTGGGGAKGKKGSAAAATGADGDADAEAEAAPADATAGDAEMATAEDGGAAPAAEEAQP